MRRVTTRRIEKENAMETKSREEIMKACTEAGRLGKEHEFLRRFVGTWDVVGRFWMEGPGGSAMESRGVAEIRWLFPGRWLEEVFKSEMMGGPYEGHGIFGYDNLKKKYVSSWVDNMGTALTTMEGNLDLEGKTLMRYGRADDPASGKHGKLMGYILHFRDGDHHVFEMRDYSLGPEGGKVMELEYTRRQQR
jgi:hypothetical protein